MSDPAERAFVESLVVRAMPQAVYQPTNIGHFGLALTHYAHFTSPIRRYPDLVVHRTLKALIGAKGGAARALRRRPSSARSGESTSRLEKRADEADRYVSSFLKCTYLSERIGQTFEGLITTVVEFGCFVQILDVGGRRPAAHRQPARRRVRDGGGRPRLARPAQRAAPAHRRARATCMVTAVNPIEGLIDLELAEEGSGATAAARR